ncbi:MAG: flagellar motor switch protein FliN [Magnetococcales bacterium]|nr:flagellar motor switch protein FliN [Magnetococcales bacterium]
MDEEEEDDLFADARKKAAAKKGRPTKGGSPLDAGDLDGLRFEMPKNLDLLMDVPLDVSVRLGHVRMQIRDLLKLNKGSLIELEKEADEPLEIYVNDRLLAFGEVVMIKDKLGIRITDIVSLAERLENLR